MQHFIITCLLICCITSFSYQYISRISSYHHRNSLVSQFAKGFVKQESDSSSPNFQFHQYPLNSPCLCGSNSSYESCCRPFHEMKETPKDIVSAARARYTAFALGIPSYVIKTTHPRQKVPMI